MDAIRTLLLAAAFAAGIGCGPALAHAELKLAVPAAEASVSAPLPTELRIGFTEPLELAFAKVTVSGADSAALAIGPLATDPADPMTLVVPLVAPLPAGTITVTWSVVSVDGHKANGTYQFSVTP